MKILAIRGRNLASLAGDFEVDFTAEPLAGAGVFAITGPTGAGKSTLLDAMSLALFHDTPRLANATERRVEIPDVGGNSISAGDPRNILRRGTGEGYAEVDYVGLNGERWRARWEIRRAREKPDGNLQQYKASLENLDKHQQLGAGVKEIREAIKHTTGLTDEQFCRSILLAQNEFAAFLRAAGPERAALLEALTDTEIYARISKLCHERTAEEKRKLESLQERLGVEPPRTEEERNELERQFEQASAQQQELEAAVQLLQREAHWHEQGRTLQRRLDGLEAELKRSEAQRAARSEDAARVRRMESIEPARPLHRDLVHATVALEQHEERRTEVSGAVEKADDDQRRAQEEVAATKERLAAAESSQAAQMPNIRRARELDRQLDLLDRERRERVEQRDDAVRKQRQAEQDHARAAQAETENLQAITAWSSWQSEHPEFPAEESSWKEAGERLREAIRAAERAADAERELARLADRAAHEQSGIQELEAALVAAREALQQARQQRIAAQQLESEIDASAIEQEREKIAERQRRLEQLAMQITERERSATALDTSRSRIQALQQQQAERTTRMQELEQAIPSAVARFEQARKAAKAGSARADQHTVALRRELVDGEPCPVCGSREHPGHPQDDTEIKRLVEELARQLETAEGELRGLQREQDAVKAAFDEAERQLEAEQAELAARAHALEQAIEALKQSLAGLELDPDNRPEQLPELLASERAALKAQTEALARRRNALEQARQAHAKAHSTADRAEATVQEVERRLEQARSAAAPTLDAHRKAAHELETSSRAASQVNEALRAVMGGDAPADLVGLAELGQHWQAGERLREAASLAESRRPLLRQQLGKLKSELEDQTAKRRRLELELSRLEAEIKAQRRLRDECVQTRDLDRLEAELEAAIRKARTARETADSKLQKAAAASIEAQTHYRNWERELQTRRAAQDQARAALANWLNEHHAAPDLEPHDLEGLLDLLAVPPEQWQRLRDELQQLEQDIRDRRTALETIAKQLEEWRAGALSERDEAEVREQLDEAIARHQEALEAKATLAAELASDNRRRDNAAKQIAAIKRQQAIFEQWAKLDELIGSSNGSKFRDYAQQFTLDVLITHANAQLRTLAPRYRLQRGVGNLNILVADDDMGGEIRGVHSLSGGETFLASLALALGLAELSSQRIRIESLFIDEGFGSLDADTLRVAMDALDRLQAQGRKVGVISHVQEMSDRIGVQVRVEPSGPGRSRVRVLG